MIDEQLKNLFSQISSQDPKIRITNCSIKVIPTYLNYVFLLNFIPLIAGVYVLTQQSDLKISLLAILLILLSLYGIFIDQIPFYNTVFINLTDKTIIITPNIFLSLFTPKKSYPFEDIKHINFFSRGFGASHVRYAIILKLKNASEEKLITTKTNDNAIKLVNALRKTINLI